MKYVISIADKSGNIRGYISRYRDDQIYNYNVAKKMLNVDGKCLFDSIEKANDFTNMLVKSIKLKILHNKIKISKREIETKTKNAWGDIVWTASGDDCEIRYVKRELYRHTYNLKLQYNPVPYTVSFEYQKSREKNQNKRWFEADNNTLCSLCHVKFPIGFKFLNIGNYVVCPFCLKDLGAEGSKILEKVLEKNPEYEQEYTVTRFAGALGTTK